MVVSLWYNNLIRYLCGINMREVTVDVMYSDYIDAMRLLDDESQLTFIEYVLQCIVNGELNREPYYEPDNEVYYNE